MHNSNSVMWFILISCIGWLLVLIVVLRNIFLRQDISLLAKLLWTFVILSFPLLGLVVYLMIGHKRVKDL